MPLVHLADMLGHAYRHAYAVGAFGVVNLDFVQGVLQAAEDCRAPEILNLIESHFSYYDLELLMPAVTVAVEGELGYAPGDEGVKIPGGLVYTLASEVKAFVERSGVDFLAASIGTVHGCMSGTPKLDYARLAKINYYTARSEVPANSIKVNVSPGQKSCKMITHGVRGAIRTEVERCIRLWGSSGRAAEVLTQCRPWREVERIVLYNQPEESLTEEAAAAMVRRSKKTLAAIPGVRRVMAGSTVNGEKRRPCWMERLATAEAAASFNSHPDQLKFVNSLSRYGAADRAAMDFEIGE